MIAGSPSQLQRVQSLLAGHRYEEAESLIGRMLASTPEEPVLLCLLSQCRLGCGRSLDALVAAEAALRLVPDDEWPHRLRSIALRGLWRAPEALAAAHTAVHLAPGMPDPLATLAQAQVSVRKLPEAYATALELVRIAPELPLSHFVMGQVAMAYKNWRVTEDANREVLRLDPLHHAAMNNLGVALQAMGRKAEALQAFQEAARLDPTDAVARNNVVRLVRPVQPQGLAIDAILAVIAPLSLPYIAGKYAFRLIRSRQWRSQLRPGARMYYDRSAWAGGIVRIETLVAGAAVLGGGLIGLGFAQAFGWTYVTTGVPVTVLFAVSVIIAGSSAIWRLARWLWYQWHSQGRSGVLPATVMSAAVASEKSAPLV